MRIISKLRFKSGVLNFQGEVITKLKCVKTFK